MSCGQRSSAKRRAAAISVYVLIRSGDGKLIHLNAAMQKEGQ
jgi:hypothetical protein